MKEAFDYELDNYEEDQDDVIRRMRVEVELDAQQKGDYSDTDYGEMSD